MLKKSIIMAYLYSVHLKICINQDLLTHDSAYQQKPVKPLRM